MRCFADVNASGKILLLVLSQLAVITLTGACVLSFRRRFHTRRQFCVGALLLLCNAVLYVLMQVDSRVGPAGEAELRLCVPYVLLSAVTLLSLVYAVLAILRETRNRKIINNTSIRESFDNLPTGVCFFNEAGLPVLCNLAMHRFSFAVCGKDAQYIDDLEECLSADFVPFGEVKREGKVFVLPDARAWQLEKRSLHYESGARYTQFVASDVTDLHRFRVELTEDNALLFEVQENIKRLSANVVAVTREEEILNTKMRVHDEMGRCLMAAEKYLKEGDVQQIPDELARSWQRAVSMLKYNNESSEEDMLLQIRKTCEFVKLDFVKRGELPEDGELAYLLTCAVRECVTNAVRYAEAKALYVDFSEQEDRASVTISNDGRVPEGEIREGGGLSTLRRRIERAGGTMVLQTRPEFRLTVSVPKRMEGAL